MGFDLDMNYMFFYDGRVNIEVEGLNALDMVECFGYVGTKCFGYP